MVALQRYCIVRFASMLFNILLTCWTLANNANNANNMLPVVVVWICTVRSYYIVFLLQFLTTPNTAKTSGVIFTIGLVWTPVKRDRWLLCHVLSHEILKYFRLKKQKRRKKNTHREKTNAYPSCCIYIFNILWSMHGITHTPFLTISKYNTTPIYFTKTFK